MKLNIYVSPEAMVNSDYLSLINMPWQLYFGLRF